VCAPDGSGVGPPPIYLKQKMASGRNSRGDDRVVKGKLGSFEDEKSSMKCETRVKG